MLVIKNGRVMDPKSGLDQVSDILVENGKSLKSLLESMLKMQKLLMLLVLWLRLAWLISMFISVNLVKLIKKTFIQEH